MGIRGKIVMRGVTGISPDWLPAFCPSSGQVRARYQGTFGQLGWPLPVTELVMVQSLDKYKWFARFFLEGEVAPDLVKYKTSLLSNPLIMVKSWSNLQKRTEIILKELARENCDNARTLSNVWSKDPKYLLSAYLS